MRLFQKTGSEALRTKPKIAVIGGGWSGLTAALTLVDAGCHVTVYEAGRALGGRARSVIIDGRRIDSGQHILLGAYHQTLLILRKVGVSVENNLARFPLRLSGSAGFSLELPRIPAPLNLAWGLLTARGVSLREKLQTARWMQALQRQHFVLDHETTVSHWLDLAGQTGVLRQQLWEPLCLAALNTPAERASARIFANVLRDSLGSSKRADTDLLIPRVPLSVLFSEPVGRWLLARGADIRLGHRVKSLTGTQVEGDSYDAVVVATAPQHAIPLLPGTAQIEVFEPIATVYLAYSTWPKRLSRKKPVYALSSPIGTLWVVQGQMLEESEECRLSVVISGAGAWESLSNTALQAEVDKALKQSGQVDHAENPVWSKVIREKRATFSCQPGLQRPPFSSGIPGVWQTGDHVWAEYPGTLEGAVRSGRKVAEQVLESLKHS